MTFAQPCIDESTGEVSRAALSVPSIHAAFDYVRPRIHSFRDMVRRRPDIVGKVQGQISRDTQEMVRSQDNLYVQRLSTVV